MTHRDELIKLLKCDCMDKCKRIDDDNFDAYSLADFILKREAEKDSQIASLKEALKGHMLENHEYIEKLTKEIASLKELVKDLSEMAQFIDQDDNKLMQGYIEGLLKRAKEACDV